MAQVDDEIARLAAEDGFYVLSRSDGVVELERKNSWRAVVLTTVLTSFPSGGGIGLPRTERVYLEVDEDGEAVVQLRRPAADS
jgi:hypothetical protein